MINPRDIPYWLIVGLSILSFFIIALSYSSAQTTHDERQVKRDCRYDAVRYCGGSVASYVANPSDDHRQTIIACMLANRDKLQAKCSRHLYQ